MAIIFARFSVYLLYLPVTFFSQLGQEDDYQRVCTCLYDEDKVSVKLDDGGNVRCEFYDGKVLSGKYAEYKIRDTYMP